MLPSRKPLSLAVSLALSTLSISASAQSESEVLSSDTPLMTVVVVGSQPVTAEPGSVTLDAADVLHLRASTSDTATLLRSVPGMSFYGAGGVSSLPVIHGLGDDRLRIKVDGMDLVSACANHMNPPLSYIDPTHFGAATVFEGLAPVSSGGDSIGGTILVDSPAPEFAEAGQGTLLKGEAGTFYRSNGNAFGANVSATAASENLSVTYSGSTAESDNYNAGGDFKPAGLAFIGGGGLPSMYNSTSWLDGDEVGSTQYKSTNQSLGFALRQDNQLLDLKLGYQHIPYQGFPNQRMDMTDNTSTQVNLGYTGEYVWGALDARVYREHTEHEMNFLEDKAFWYMGNAPGMPMFTEGDNLGGTVKGDIVLSARDRVRVGGEVQQYRLDDYWPASGTGGMSPNTFLNINDGERDRYAAFAEWEAQWVPQWLSQFGLRYERVNMNAGEVQGYNTGGTYAGDAAAFNASDRALSDNNIDLTLLARYTPVDTQTIEFGYARKTRSPNLYERYSWSTGGMAMNMVNMAGDGNGYVGNLELDPEIAHTLSASFDWHDASRQGWGLRVTPYYTYVDDYINARRCGPADTKATGGTLCSNPVNLTTTNQFVFLKFDNQDAQLYGIDISGSAELAQHTDFGSFTVNGLLNYVRGETTSGTDDNLYNIMPLNATLALTQTLGGWTNIAEVLMVDAKTDVSQIRNEVETPGYSLLNLRSSYSWKTVRLDLGIENVFDTLYFYPLGGAYVGQGITMPPGPGTGRPAWGITVPGMGRSIYAGLNFKF